MSRRHLFVAVSLTLAVALAGCILPVKLNPPEAIAAAKASLAPAYRDWTDIEVTLRPRVWVVTFRNVKTTPDQLGWPDATYPQGQTSRYRDATAYVDADTGTVVKKELTP